MSAVFLSHSSQDKPLAKKLARELTEAGVDVWLDEWNIAVGDSISTRIQEGLDSSDYVAVMLTKSSVSSGWVNKEWQSKVGDEASRRQTIILPLKFDDCDVPRLLRDKKYADFSSDYDAAFKHLLHSVALTENFQPKPKVSRLRMERIRSALR